MTTQTLQSEFWALPACARGVGAGGPGVHRVGVGGVGRVNIAPQSAKLHLNLFSNAKLAYKIHGGNVRYLNLWVESIFKRKNYQYAARVGMEPQYACSYSLLALRSLLCYANVQKYTIFSNLHAELQIITWEYSSRFPHFVEAWG